MFKLRSALIAVTLTASAVTATTSAAEAASNVTIHQVADKTIAKDATATVRPSVGHAHGVVVSSKTITVTSGSKTVVNHKTSGRLKPGTYRLTTDVTFKTPQSSGVRHKSKSQTLHIKVKAAKPAPSAKHACTTTASGSCIAGGQFCPQAKYGLSGWDASGRRYVCTGDSTHPHWMVP
jgi:hypothetical protein